MAATLSAHALTTLQAVKDELSLGVAPHADDDYLTKRINAVSDDIEKFCGRHFELVTLSGATAEKHPADGQLEFLLEHSPLVTLTGVAFADVDLDAGLYEVVDTEAGRVRLLYGAADESMIAANITGDPLPGTSRRLYAVSYTGGYVLPKDDGVGVPPAVRTLPDGLEDACILEVVSRYRQRGRDRAVTSEKIMSWSETRAAPESGASGLTPEVERKVRGYRRILL